MTGLLIDGQNYSLDEIAEASLGDLFTLKVKTKALGYGVSLKSINEMFDRLSKKVEAEAEVDIQREERLAADPGADVSDLPAWDPMSLLDDEDYIVNMIGLVYLTRRIAGDDITVEQAWKSPFNSVTLAGPDDDELEEEASPKDEAAQPTDELDS